ncbi:divalent-cation tolerance protein CutA [Algiphilus sp. W345]|uniref:Divalent-cation tolerance protein CutA n=1 Tax=Banduia mediterranea TaxID=3075609 RepID=A0ABU2WK85_9GAMM|nr:divalent-cation tolerance protein CutA [Algiphilus sp. W345]MDT0498288.1 divalent-cation tolerance protein CutA [Algiphilus sp. W345]
MSTDISIVYISCPASAAQTLANALVESNLAACVTLLPGARSVYRWQGKVHNDEETLLLAKTRTERVGALCERVVADHPHEVPEVIAVELAQGHAPYLDWVASETDAD